MKQKLYQSLSYIILLLVLLSTFFVYKSAINLLDMQRRERFLRKVQMVEASIKERLAIYADAQYAGTGLFLSSENVSRKDWFEFVKALHLLERYPGIHGIGFIVPVSKEDSADFIAETRKDSAAGFKITQFENSISDSDLFIVKFLEPYALNKEAMGLDMGSEPKRRSAMERARDLGKPVITDKIQLVQDKTSSPGFLMFVPFYKNGFVPLTVEERRKNFIGWIYAPFIAADFMEAIRRLSLADTRDLVHIEVYDDKPFDKTNLMYESPDTEKTNEQLAVVLSLDFYTNIWHLKITPTSLLSELYSHKRYWLIWLGGGLLALSLFYVVYLLTSTRRHAIELAKEMTVEISRQKDELQQKNLDLERSNHDLEQFAYVASHDLKEPLRMVNIYTQLLSEKYKDKFDEEGKDFIKFATEGASRMSSLINDLLIYARVGNSEKTKKTVDISKVIKNVLKSLEVQIAEYKAEINVQDPMPVVTGAENYLASLFQNLISNALKYSKDDVSPVINISAELISDSWLFTISDNGIGIEADHLEKIFIIFQRLHLKHEYTGTGIGLAICKKIVEFHGGKIWAESNLGEGTNIYFTLPVDEAEMNSIS